MFIEQAIRLVSQSPDNLAYHLLILLTIQSVLALATWQWRQQRQDTFAARLAGAALAMLLLRIALAYLLATTPQSRLVSMLPPLERAMDLIISAVLVWALIPAPQKTPRLTDVLLLFGLLIIGTAYMLSAQAWPALLEQGISYPLTRQATFWLMAQTILLGGGLLFIFLTRPLDWLLRWLVLWSLALAHLAHLLNVYPNGDQILDTSVPYWVRLAYLIALPLLSILVYRHNLAQLLLKFGSGARPLGTQIEMLFELSGAVITSDTTQALHHAARLTAKVMQAQFVALGLLNEANTLSLISYQPDVDGESPQWLLNITDWPGIQLAVRQQTTIELLPNGLGARQLFLLYQELGIGPYGAMLIEAVRTDEQHPLGVLFLAGPPSKTAWREDEKRLISHISRYIARVVTLIQSPSAIDATAQARLAWLERERDQAEKRALALADHLQQIRRELQIAQTRIREDMDDTRPEHAPTAHTPLPHWVAHALTRYSAELGEARQRIIQLEAETPQKLLTPSSDISAILSAVVQALLPQVHEKQLVLDIQVASPLPPISIQPSAAQELLQILLRNAIRVTRPNGRMRVDVEVGEFTDPGQPPFAFLKLLIVDEGSGIPPEMLPLLLHVRHKAIMIPGVSDEVDLKQVYELTRAHGGRMWVESQQGIGSTLYLLFPVVGEPA